MLLLTCSSCLSGHLSCPLSNRRRKDESDLPWSIHCWINYHYGAIVYGSHPIFIVNWLYSSLSVCNSVSSSYSRPFLASHAITGYGSYLSSNLFMRVVPIELCRYTDKFVECLTDKSMRDFHAFLGLQTALIENCYTSTSSYFFYISTLDSCILSMFQSFFFSFSFPWTGSVTERGGGVSMVRISKGKSTKRISGSEKGERVCRMREC